jgi:hypothetical protein
MFGRSLGLVVACSVFGGALAVGTPADAASFTVRTTAETRGQNTSSTRDEKSSGTSASPVTLLSTSSFADEAVSQSSGYAFASAGVGALKGYSTASAVVYPTLESRGAIGSGDTRAEYRDSFFLSAPGVAAGTVGVMTADVLLDGFLSGGLVGSQFARGEARWAAQVFVNDSFAFYNRQLYGDVVGGGSETGDVAALQMPTFQVVFGQMNEIVMSLQTVAGASALVNFAGSTETRSAAFTSDFGSTLTWEGIRNLTVDGRAVTDFTAISGDTGFDFRRGFGAVAPVPEPATWAIMVLGFGFIGACIRRARFALA